MSGLRTTVIVGLSISFAASALLVAFGVYFLAAGNWVLGIAMIAAAVLALIGGIGVLRGFRPIIGKASNETTEP
jgi:multisubunit Na+/H+ antiporter MnhC subunit